jgi:hypothetical protein
VFLGLESSELFGKSWFDLVAEDQLSGCRAIWDEKSCADADFSVEFPVHPNYVHRHVKTGTADNRVWLGASFTYNRSLQSWDIELSHISSRRRVFEQLEEMEMMQAFPPTWALFDWDITSDHIVLSPNFREFFLGLSLNESPDSLAAYARYIHPQDSAATISALERSLLQRQAYIIDYRIRHRTGTYKMLRVRGRVDYDDDDRAVRLSGSAQDISELLDLQTRLASARDDLVRALQLKEQFMSNMSYVQYVWIDGAFVLMRCSHEIRTPLNGIIGARAQSQARVVLLMRSLPQRRNDPVPLGYITVARTARVGHNDPIQRRVLTLGRERRSGLYQTRYYSVENWQEAFSEGLTYWWYPARGRTAERGSGSGEHCVHSARCGATGQRNRLQEGSFAETRDRSRLAYDCPDRSIAIAADLEQVRLIVMGFFYPSVSVNLRAQPCIERRQVHAQGRCRGACVDLAPRGQRCHSSSSGHRHRHWNPRRLCVSYL